MYMVGHHRKNGDFHVGVDFRNLFHALLGVFANGGQFGNAVLYVPKDTIGEKNLKDLFGRGTRRSGNI